MRIKCLKVQLAGNQEDHSLDSRQTREAASATLGALAQAIDGLQKAVGLARLRPGHDALQVRADHPGNVLHGIDLGAHHAGAPMTKHRPHDIDLQDLTQLLLVDLCQHL